MDINWEEPPEYALHVGSGRQAGRYLEFAVALREHPGKWAALPSTETRTEKGARATAQNILRGKVKGFAAREFEVAVHGTGIWVRYIGKDGAALASSMGDSDQPEDDAEEDDAEDEPTQIHDIPHPQQPDPAEVRAWARNQGWNIPAKGRLPQNVIDAYTQAHRRRTVRALP